MGDDELWCSSALSPVNSAEPLANVHWEYRTAGPGIAGNCALRNLVFENCSV